MIYAWGLVLGVARTMLEHYDMAGEWAGAYDFIQFDFLRHNAGLASANFYTNSTNNLLGLQLVLFDPRYVDGNKAEIYMELPLASYRSDDFRLQYTEETVILLKGQEAVVRTSCLADIRISLLQGRLELYYAGREEDCKGRFRAVLQEDRQRSRSLWLAAFLALPALVTGAACKWLKQRLSDNPFQGARISLSLLLVMVYQLLIMFLFLLYLGTARLLSGLAGLAFSGAALAYLYASLLVLRLAIKVWRSSLGSLNAQQIKRQVLIFYMRFYLGFFLFFTAAVMFNLASNSTLLLLQSLTLLLQVAKNAYRGIAPGFYPQLIFGVVGANLLVPLYFRGCPHNLTHITPNYWLLPGQLLLFGAQVALLFLQLKKGPRFFVPTVLLPNYYRYSKLIRPDPQQQLTDECVICLVHFFTPEQREQKTSRKIWETPCGHRFHPRCLRDWLEVKLECPSCRTALPVP